MLQLLWKDQSSASCLNSDSTTSGGASELDILLLLEVQSDEWAPLKTQHGGTETHSDAPATNPQPPPDQECDAAAALAAFSCLAFFEAS